MPRLVARRQRRAEAGQAEGDRWRLWEPLSPSVPPGEDRSLRPSPVAPEGSTAPDMLYRTSQCHHAVNQCHSIPSTSSGHYSTPRALLHRAPRRPGRPQARCCPPPASHGCEHAPNQSAGGIRARKKATLIYLLTQILQEREKLQKPDLPPGSPVVKLKC